MTKHKVVWDDSIGDLRKSPQLDSKSKNNSQSSVIDTKSLQLHLRRLTSGKGRTVIEITNLPKHESWCLDLAKKLKKSLGVGGTYKNNYIEIHAETIDLVTAILDKLSLKWKKIGG